MRGAEAVAVDPLSGLHFAPMPPAPKGALPPVTVADPASLNAAWEPERITESDFFRLRRAGAGWVTEMVRVDGEKVLFRRDVWAWDTYEGAENRMVSYASEAEKRK